MLEFKNPPKQYRGAPFWAWNCKVNKEMLAKQIRCFKEMGFGGYHMHTRLGMTTEYLSDEFMDYISFCVEEGKKENMSSYLYDEDRWPSGYAGGLVTMKPKFRQRILCITKDEKSLPHFEEDKKKAFEEGLPYLVGCYDIAFDEKGFLKNFCMIDKNAVAKYEKYYAYATAEELTDRYNFQTYVDILQPEAIARFIELTHDRYYECFKEEYGKSIPSIFSDEPRHVPMVQMSELDSECVAVYAWTYGFEKSFEEKYQYSFVDNLPYLVWDTANKDCCHVRYHFFNHVEDLFEKAFFHQISEVTTRQNLSFTGHLMSEHLLLDQLSRTGDGMRQYPYFDIPGIDVLFDRVELVTAKQTQSIVRQYGKKAMMSELYGVTGWDFDFKCLKMQGDWQAALGVTLRVPHLSWMSMAGLAKRDYPASFNYQSPWYKEFAYIEDHFARLNTVLTRGKSKVNVAMLHPMETTMLSYTTKEKSAAYLEQQEKEHQDLIHWLLYAGIDFDFLNEALLPTQVTECSQNLKVGEMEYRAIVIPPIKTIRSTTLEILEAFLAKGGKIIFTGKCPLYVDGMLSDRAQNLFDTSIYCGMDETLLVDLLEEERLVRFQNVDGTNTKHLVYQLREEEDAQWLFLAQAKKMGKTDAERSILDAREIIVTLKGRFYPSVYDTLSGEIKSVEYTHCEGKTTIRYKLYANDSLLLRLSKESETLPSMHQDKLHKVGEQLFWDKVSYRRWEPNVVVFDIGQYAIDGDVYSQNEYVLEMNRQIYEKLGLIYNEAQPYVCKSKGEIHQVSVRYEFDSEIAVEGLSLALENAEDCVVRFNGTIVKNTISGYYVDEAFKTIPLPKSIVGNNVIEIEVPFSERSRLEACYLLGEFDVKLASCMTTIIPPSKEIGFGAVSAQGMPFYGGNVSYYTEIETEECMARFHVANFGAHCVRVFVDGEDAGLIALAPFVVEKKLKAGKHVVEFLCYGNRNNTFGPVHNCRMTDSNYYIEPDVWEKSCKYWRPAYFFQDTGILSSPIIEFLK